MKKNQQGFSLIELLIVVVIIGIIAAIAIPNLLAARRASNEAAAISTLRTMNTAEATCQSTNAGSGPGQYCTQTQLVTANLLDQTFSAATATKSGYNFTLKEVATGTPASNSGFDAKAEPTVGGSTGTRAFATYEAGVIYGTDPKAATPQYTAPTIIHATGVSTDGTPLQ